MLWLFGRLATTGSSMATYEQAEEPVSRLINEFGPPVANPARARQRAAMPFVHLERGLWDLRDGPGREIGPDAQERRAWLVARNAVGQLRPEVEQLLSDRATLAAARFTRATTATVHAELEALASWLGLPAVSLA